MDTLHIHIEVPAANVQHLIDATIGGVYSGWIAEMSVNIDNLEDSWIVYTPEDAEEGDFTEVLWLSPSRLAYGVKTFLELSARRFGNLLRDDTDAEDADVFMQALVFGREVYG